MTSPPRPHALRDYAFLADGERGAVVGPHGEIVWLCAPVWDSDAVFASLIGGSGSYTVRPADDWHVWGGYDEDGGLIHVSRWVTPDAVIECRQALVMPAYPERLILLRRVRAVRGTARTRIALGLSAADGGATASPDLSPAGHGVWTARGGGLYVRWSGVPGARVGAAGDVSASLTVPAGGAHDLVLEISVHPSGALPDPDQLWRTTERAWRDVVPDCAGLAAPRDARHAYAVLRGMTSSAGGMVAAATTSLPERANTGRTYDYRYAWLRDQCYAALAVAAHGPHPLLDSAVRFATDRVLTDGDRLRPAYTVTGGRVPGERDLDVRGYPGGTGRVGNRAGNQFQLDTFGELLQLFAAAARHGVLPRDGHRAAEVVIDAVERLWQRPDAGLWELDNRWWTHSRLAAVTGLGALARQLTGRRARRCRDLADTVLAGTRRRCLAPEGWWVRAAGDPAAECGVLLPLARGGLPPGDPSVARTRAFVTRRLAEDGYLYRFRHPGVPLGEAEGAFLLCGFLAALAAHRDGDRLEAVRWFERTRAACGSPGLFTEEFDVGQRQLRGNLPQAFVHPLLLETAVALGPGP